MQSKKGQHMRVVISVSKNLSKVYINKTCNQVKVCKLKCN